MNNQKSIAQQLLECNYSIQVYEGIVCRFKNEGDEAKQNIYGAALVLLQIRKQLLEEEKDVDALIEEYDQFVENISES